MKGTLLRDFLLKSAKSQADAAKMLGTSGPSLSQLIHRGAWPRKGTEAFRSRLAAFLESKGVTLAEIAAVFCELDADENSTNNHEEVTMIRKQVLSAEARRAFKITREIFTDEFSDPEDVFFSPETRYVRECVYQIARHGGMMALVGESGSGKTTLFRELKDRLIREEARVIVIEPYVLGMDNGNKKAVAMRATHLCEAILAALRVPFKATATPEALFKFTHEKLRDSSRGGYRHLLCIEEAHSLPPSMFKYLKRFLELSDGLTRLLSLLLVGQTELKNKLAETNAEHREFIQRTELIEMLPMDDLEGYVRHRCARAGVTFDDVFAPDALPALSLRLTGPRPKGGSAGQSMLYPLLVGNMLTRAMNLAVGLKMNKVTADAVRSA